MSFKLKKVWFAGGFALGLLGVVAAVVAETAELRGFGRLEMTSRFAGAGNSRSAWVTFKAADAQKAAVCGSKLLADLTGFGDLQVKANASLSGTVLELADAGTWLIGLDGRRVQVLFARDHQALQALADSAWTGIRPWPAATGSLIGCCLVGLNRNGRNSPGT